MKISKSRLKEIIREEILTERLKRFKVYVSGEKEPLVLMGKNEKEVKQLAHQMIQNSSIKIKKVVKEIAVKISKIDKENEGKMAKYDAKEVCQDAADVYKMINVHDDLPEWLEAKITLSAHNMNAVKDYLTHHQNGGKVDESWDGPQKFSSKEAQKIIDGSLKDYAKDLRKVQYRVVKDWMSKAKAGVIDYFDLIRGLTTGDISRAHPYEAEFLHKVLTRDKIIDRFRSYFGGKKGKASRTKKRK